MKVRGVCALLSALSSGCSMMIGDISYEGATRAVDEGGSMSSEAGSLLDADPETQAGWALNQTPTVEGRFDLSLGPIWPVLDAPHLSPPDNSHDMGEVAMGGVALVDMEIAAPDQALPDMSLEDMTPPPVEPNCDRCVGVYETCRAMCMNTFDQQSGGNGYEDGRCVSEGGRDPSTCCECSNPMPFKACSQCLSGHASCVEACSGLANSYCHNPYSTDFGDCCICEP